MEQKGIPSILTFTAQMTREVEMSITIPKNIRQMGEPEEKRKIYVEDYVVTYLKQYAKEEILNSRGAVLLGNAQEQEGISYLFIRSALELAEHAVADGTVAFTEELWMQVYEEIEKYFQGQEILGWFLSTPGFSPEISYEILSTHRNFFPGQDKVLFMEDPTEGEETFFAMNQGSLVRQRGYIIFYERNMPMQQYMLEKRGGKSVDNREEFTDRAARSFRMLVQERKEQSDQKRIMAFLYGVSTFLVMVVLVIGITMINNYEKMEQVEMALTNLTESMETQQETAQAEDLSDLLSAEQQESLEGQPLEAGSETNSPQEAESEALEPAAPEGTPEGAGNPGDIQASPSEEPPAPPAEEQPTEAPENPSSEEQPNEMQETSAPVTPSSTYIVQKGDTLLSISRKIYGNDRHIKEICQLNNIEDSDKIYAGEKILLP